MMRRTMRVPLIQEASRSESELVPAIGVADFQNRSGHRLTFRGQELEFAVDSLHDGQQSDWTMLHRHLHRESVAHLAVIYLKRPDFGFSLCDGDMSRSVVPHENHIVVVIHSVVFGERASHAE